MHPLQPTPISFCAILKFGISLNTHSTRPMFFVMKKGIAKPSMSVRH